MGQLIVRTPGGEWMTRAQARRFLGLAEDQIKRLVLAGWLHPEGKGKGQRFESSEVHAVAKLWRKIRSLLPPEPETPAK